MVISWQVKERESFVVVAKRCESFAVFVFFSYSGVQGASPSQVHSPNTPTTGRFYFLPTVNEKTFL